MVTLTRPLRGDLTAASRANGPNRWFRVLVAVLLCAGLAGITYLLFSGPEDGPVGTGAPARSGRSGAPSSSPAGATGAAGAATAGTTGAAAETGSPARNPFGSLTGQGATGPTATGPAAAPGPAGPAAAAAGSGAAAGGPSSALSTIRVTVSASALYLGLYDWTSDNRPSFRVNDATVVATAGSAVAPGLVYRGAFTSKSLKCANITYRGKAGSLCEGEVLELG